MLIWMCALHCEAKPVIDRYRLKKSSQITGFDLYKNEDIACVVSGVGAINMAGACAWVAAAFRDQQTLCWINLGTGGHKDFIIGTPILASKINQANLSAAIYPVPLTKHPFQSCSVISLPNESTRYDDHVVFDLEAYAFIKTSRRFSPLELCQSIKIISDNSSTPPDRDKARISQLIAVNMPVIADFATALQGLAHDAAKQSLDTRKLQQFLALAHFTESQRIQLQKVLLGLRFFDSDLCDAYADVSDLDCGKQIINSLQRKLHGSCVSF